MTIEEALKKADEIGYKKYGQGDKLNDVEEALLVVGAAYIKGPGNVVDAIDSMEIALEKLKKLAPKKNDPKEG